MKSLVFGSVFLALGVATCFGQLTFTLGPDIGPRPSHPLPSTAWSFALPTGASVRGVDAEGNLAMGFIGSGASRLPAEFYPDGSFNLLPVPTLPFGETLTSLSLNLMSADGSVIVGEYGIPSDSNPHFQDPYSVAIWVNGVPKWVPAQQNTQIFVSFMTSNGRFMAGDYLTGHDHAFVMVDEKMYLMENLFGAYLPPFSFWDAILDVSEDGKTVIGTVHTETGQFYRYTVTNFDAVWNSTPSAVPEPTSYGVVSACALAALVVCRRKPKPLVRS